MFPRTQIENLSVSRLMIGTNWLLGFSHTSKAKDRFIRETVDAKRIADILTVALGRRGGHASTACGRSRS